MFWNDVRLKKWAEDGGVNPFDPETINPASIDLRWSGRARIFVPPALCDFGGNEGWSDIKEFGELRLIPGFLYLLDSREYVSIPTTCVGWLALKSSMGRKGLEHLHAGFFDPGFHGTATLEVEVRAPEALTIVKGQKIIQMALAECYEPERDYTKTGRYNGQVGPTSAR